MILYTRPVSSFGLKVRFVLAAKGLQAELREPPDGYGSDAYRKISPLGKIPALVDRGVLLAESDTIMEYLDEQYPEPPLMPRDPLARARARFFARFHDLYLEPPLRGLFPLLGREAADAPAVAAKLAEVAKRLAEFELVADPAPFLAGPALSLGDLAYPATLAVADCLYASLGAGVPPYGPRLQAWRPLVDAHPAVAGLLAGYRAVLADWAAQKLAQVPAATNAR